MVLRTSPRVELGTGQKQQRKTLPPATHREVSGREIICYPLEYNVSDFTSKRLQQNETEEGFNSLYMKEEREREGGRRVNSETVFIGINIQIQKYVTA